MKDRAQVDELLKVAGELLTLSEGGALELFEERALTYLERFNAWEEQFDRSSVSSPEVVEILRLLQEKHLQVIAHVAAWRDRVGLELGETHRRGKALKAYVDQFPKRITLTGKRKG